MKGEWGSCRNRLALKAAYNIIYKLITLFLLVIIIIRLLVS